MESLPEHLGGHSNRTHMDRGALKALIARLGTKSCSFLDIGCGPGGMLEDARLLSLDPYGIDGDFVVERNGFLKDRITIHDYTKGPSPLNRTYDIGWSTEFLEHVDEEFQDNYMEDFKKCHFVIMTHAPEGKHGHHHVNCKSSKYWIEVFEKHGFRFDPDLTRLIRRSSTMKRSFMRENGHVFENLA